MWGGGGSGFPLELFENKETFAKSRCGDPIGSGRGRGRSLLLLRQKERGVALQSNGKTRCCSEGGRSRKSLQSRFGNARAIGRFSVVGIPGNVSRTCQLVRVDSCENVTSDEARGRRATNSPRAPPLSRDPHLGRYVSSYVLWSFG